MDFKSMKRKDLQALCKKHGLPANTTNSQMIDSLSSILQEKIKPKGCLKGSGGSSAEDLGIIKGDSKKVTFVFEDEEEDGDEEFTMNPVGKLKSKSTRRRPSIAPEHDKERKEIEKGSQYESLKSVDEVPRRATRSRGLAESVLWSPVMEKKKKNGAEGVRQNAKPSMDKEKKVILAEVPSIRLLRNRVVVVDGGDEESVADKNERNTQKRKNSDKKEQKEKVSALLKEDEDVGNKNLRKRSREEDIVKDEPPPRRPTRNHAKLEETAATEEVDVGRSKKRRRGGMEALPVEKVVNEETASGSTAKRSRGNTLDSNAMEPGDVTGPTGRSTYSSSALLEAGNFVFAVGKSDQEGKAVRKNKSKKQAKRGDSASLLVDNEVVAEPARRSTRSSSTLLKDETSLPVGGKSIKGCEPLPKGKSQKQATLLPAREAVAVPVRRSKHSSSALQKEETSTISVGESVEGGEVVGKSRSQKQAKEHDLREGVSKIPPPVAEVVAEPVRRSTRHSSNLVEEGNSLPVIGKSIKGGEAARKGKTQKQAKDHGSTGGGSRASLADNEVTVEPVRRSTCSSSSLLENKTSPVVGKSVKEGKAVQKGKSQKQSKGHASEGEVSMASFSDNEAIDDSTKLLSHGSSKTLENESHIIAVGKLVGDAEAIRNNKAGKRKRDDSIGGDAATSLPDSRAVITPTRRSIHSHCDAVRKGNSLKKPKAHIIEQGDSTTSLLDNEAVTTPGRRSTRHSSKVPADSEVPKSQFSPHLCNEAVITPARRSTHHSSKVPADSEVVNSPCSSHPDIEASITPTRRSTCHSSKVPADSEVLKNPCSPNLDNEAVTTPARRSTCHLLEGPADSEVLKSPCSPHPASSLLEDITEAHVKEEQVDMKRMSIGGTDIAGQISVPGHLDTALTEVSNDVDPETAAKMRQSPESVLLEKIEYDTSLVGAPKDLDDVSLSSHIIEGHSSLMEAANNNRGESPLNIVKVSSEIQEDFSRKPGCLNVDAAVKAGTSELYGDYIDVTSALRKSSVGALDVDGLTSMESQNIVSPAVPPTSSEEQSTTFHTEISTMAYLKVPDSTAELDPDHKDILTMHVTASYLPCKSSDKLSLTSDAEASPGFASKKPGPGLEISGATEVGLQGNEATNISRPALVGKSSEELLPTSDTDILPEIDPEEPELQVEVEGPMEDFMVSGGTDKILMTSTVEVCSETFCGNNNQESDSKAVVLIGNKGFMEGTEATNTSGSPLSCKSAGVLSPTFFPSLRNEISPEIDVREPDLRAHTETMSKVASDFSTSLVEASGTHSKTLEVSMTAERDAGSLSNIQRSFDDEVENCKVDMDTIQPAQLALEECHAGEKIEASIAGSESQSCIGMGAIKETCVSSIFSVTVNDDAETEGGKSGAGKDGDELRPSSPSENPACDLDTGDHINEPGSPSSAAQLTLEECDAGKTIEASIAGSESQACIGLEVIKETWISSTLSVMVNDDAETEDGKSGAGKNGDELRPSSPIENPACDLDACDYINEPGSPSLTAQLTLEECDSGKKIEASIAASEPQACIGLEVIKETWISSTLSVTMNDNAETEGDTSGTEKNGDELRPRSPSENPVCDLDTSDHMKEWGSPSTEETVDGTSTQCSHGGLKKSDFTQSLYDKEPADADGNSRDSFDDKFCEDIGKHFQSPDVFMKPAGASYVLPMASKDGESTPSQIAAVSSKVMEGKSSVDHGSSIQTLAASGRLVKHLDKEDVVLVNADSTEISALTIENRSPADVVLFGGDTKSMDIAVSVICDEEILPVTTSETPATLSYKGSSNKGNIQERPCVPDSKPLRLLSDHQDVSLTQSLGVDSVNSCPKSAPAGHEASEQLNEVADILRETVHTANELANVEHERSLELAAIDAEEMENIESLEGVTSMEGKDGTVMKEADSIGRGALDCFDEVCEKRDDAFLTQEIKDLPGELHISDVTCSMLHNSASTLQDEGVLLLENFAVPTEMGNVPSLPKRDLVLSNEDQLTEDNTEKVSAEEETLNSEEFRCSVTSVPIASRKESPVPSLPKRDLVLSNEDQLTEDNTRKVSAEEETLNSEEFRCSVTSVPMASQKESPESDMLKENTLSAGSLGLASSPGTYLADSQNFGGKSTEQKEIGERIGSRLPCNVHSEFDSQRGYLPACGKFNQEERTQVSSVKTDSVFLAGEEDIVPSTSESTYLVPGDTFKCEVLDSGSGDAYNANNDNDMMPEENSDYNSLIASTKEAEAKHCLNHGINMFISRMAQDAGSAGISENTEASSPGDHSLVGLEKPFDLSSKERLVTVFTTSSSKPHSQDGQSSKYRGTFECFEQASNVEAAWVSPDAMLMFAEDLFRMDGESANFVNDGARVGQSGSHEQNLGHGKCGDFSDINTADSIATGDGERNAVVLSGRPDEKCEEACPYNREISPKAENLSSSPAKPCADADDQAIHLADQTEDQEERKSIQETSEVSQFRKEELFTVLEVTKIEDSPTVMSKSGRSESMLIPTIAKQEELITRNRIELSLTNVADQAVSWDYKDSSATERSNGNELEDPDNKGVCSGQRALASLDAEAVGVNSAAIQETIVSEDETVAPEEYFEDFCWSFDVDSSQHEAESTPDKADHSSKSRNDVSEEQNRSSDLKQAEDSKERVDLKQTEDSEECVPSTPMQLTRNFEPCSVIDDAIRNKENTVGLKMGSTQKHGEKSAISTSSRRPLQSVLRTKSER